MNSAAYKIRLAAEADCPAIARVHVDTWRTTYVGIAPDDFLARMSYERSAVINRDIMRQPGVTTFVAEFSGPGVVGFATCGPRREGNAQYMGELYGLYLFKAHQGRGIGRALCQRVMEQLKSSGHASMLCWVMRDNHSRKFYERIGGQLLPETNTLKLSGRDVAEVCYGWPSFE